MKKYQEFKQTLQVEDTVDEVNKTTNKEKSGTSNTGAGKGGESEGSNKSTVKTKGNNDETKDVNKTTKVNAKESKYSDFKNSLNEDRLSKSKGICKAIKAQTDNEEIITMADGIIKDIDKGELTPKQSEWIYKTSTSMKK